MLYGAYEGENLAPVSSSRRVDYLPQGEEDSGVAGGEGGGSGSVGSGVGRAPPFSHWQCIGPHHIHHPGTDTFAVAPGPISSRRLDAATAANNNEDDDGSISSSSRRSRRRRSKSASFHLSLSRRLGEEETDDENRNDAVSDAAGLQEERGVRIFRGVPRAALSGLRSGIGRKWAGRGDRVVLRHSFRAADAGRARDRAAGRGPFPVRGRSEVPRAPRQGRRADDDRVSYRAQAVRQSNEVDKLLPVL
jgi:hypothetical protein